MHTMNSVTGHSAAKIFFVSLIGAVILRGIFNSIMPLSGEEAYYWMWSRHPDLCYFDHPPLIAWVMESLPALFGHSVFAVRLSALLSNTLTALIIFFCTLRITRDRVVAAWAGGLFLVAVFFAAMATLAIPDSYLFLLWSLTLWLTIEATRGERPSLWVAVGAALGLCMLAKFHAVLLALSILSYLLVSRTSAKTLLARLAVPGNGYCRTLYPAHLGLELKGRLADIHLPAIQQAALHSGKPCISP